MANNEQVTKGYKVANPDGSCRGYQYEVGKEYEHKGSISLCNAGFHFCKAIADCFNYYDFNPKNKVFEVEAIGDVIDGDDKSVCSRLKIIREISWNEMLELANTGKGNTGIRNTGDRNSGDRNSGDLNSGDRNSGDRNSGYRNSGDRNSGYLNSGYLNSGDRNSGYLNSGYRNSGYRNSGDRNSGDRNSGDLNSGYRNSGYLNNGNHNSGIFCTGSPAIMMFNKPSTMTLKEFEQTEAYRRARYDVDTTLWVDEGLMSEQEKEDNPTYKVRGGYLKVIPFKEAFVNAWGNWNDKTKKAFTSLPNFDADIFFEITGVKINNDAK